MFTKLWLCIVNLNWSFFWKSIVYTDTSTGIQVKNWTWNTATYFFPCSYCSCLSVAIHKRRTKYNHWKMPWVNSHKQPHSEVSRLWSHILQVISRSRWKSLSAGFRRSDDQERDQLVLKIPKTQEASTSAALFSAKFSHRPSYSFRWTPGVLCRTAALTAGRAGNPHMVFLDYQTIHTTASRWVEVLFWAVLGWRLALIGMSDSMLNFWWGFSFGRAGWVCFGFF